MIVTCNNHEALKYLRFHHAWYLGYTGPFMSQFKLPVLGIGVSELLLVLQATDVRIRWVVSDPSFDQQQTFLHEAPHKSLSKVSGLRLLVLICCAQQTSFTKAINRNYAALGAVCFLMEDKTEQKKERLATLLFHQHIQTGLNCRAFLCARSRGCSGP